ncbi:MAG: MBL fold metallo-hydrolase [Kosmotoga sp.]|nr:MAG: MBL fold metallo-hydrolase [Kosmotoga sp.]
MNKNSQMLKKEKIGNRGTLFTLESEEFIVTVYVIEGEKYNFLIDTLTGPETIAEVKDFIKKELNDKQLFIIYTHSHYDHTWGTCLFDKSIVVAHEKCYELLDMNERNLLKEKPELADGEVEIVLPDIIFKESMNFPEEDLELIYTPGHTVDSLSIYDKKDRVLFVGDNIELPLPMLQWNNLERFGKTLKNYLEMDFDILLSSHSRNIGRKSIEDHLDYVNAIISGNDEKYRQGKIAKIHEFNMKNLGGGKT